MRTWVPALACAVAIAPRAHAQSDDPNQRAAAAFQRFEVSYAAGDVKGARGFMQEAFDLSRRSELLYNLAELDLELGDCRTALREYRDYLRLTVEPGHRTEAEDHIAALGAQCPAPLQAKPATPPPRYTLAAPEKPYWSAPRVTGWALLGVSAVATASSVYFGLRMRATAREEEALIERSNRAAASERESWDTSGQPLEARGEREQILTWGSGAIALIAAGAGAYLLHRAARETAPSSATWSLVVQRERAVAGCSLRF